VHALANTRGRIGVAVGIAALARPRHVFLVD
jgi:hypothetical protein